MIKNFLINNQKLISYAFFGGMGVLLDLGFYTFLIFAEVNYQIANVVGYSAGTLLSFFLNREYTFKIKDKMLKRLFSFFSVAFIGYTFSALLLYVLISVFNIDELISKIITLIFVLIIQFTLNKKITFKE